MVRGNSHILMDKNTQFVSFFVHRRKSWDCFRILYPVLPLESETELKQHSLLLISSFQGFASLSWFLAVWLHITKVNSFGNTYGFIWWSWGIPSVMIKYGVSKYNPDRTLQKSYESEMVKDCKLFCSSTIGNFLIFLLDLLNLFTIHEVKNHRRILFWLLLV